jgi:hypothetical protein
MPLSQSSARGHYKGPQDAVQVKEHADILRVENIGTTSDGTHVYPGSGSPEDPYVVDWLVEDAENPYNWSRIRKWVITAQVRVSSMFMGRGSHPRPACFVYMDCVFRQ